MTSGLVEIDLERRESIVKIGKHATHIGLLHLGDLLRGQDADAVGADPPHVLDHIRQSAGGDVDQIEQTGFRVLCQYRRE